MSKGVVKATFFNQHGLSVGSSISTKFPDYLDRLDIRTKAYWFLCRGYGHPDAFSVLLDSQGQQYLIRELDEPLQQLMHSELLEKENGLEQDVLEFHRRKGYGSVGGNQ